MSNYGPKQMKLYETENNLRRKESRTGDVIEDIGQNTAVRAYSTKPGQLSAKQEAEKIARQVKKLSGPVKQYSAEELAEFTRIYKKAV